MSAKSINSVLLTLLLLIATCTFGQSLYTSQYQSTVVMQPIMERYARLTVGVNYIQGSLGTVLITARNTDGAVSKMSASILLKNENGTRTSGWIQMLFDRGLPFGAVVSTTPFECICTGCFDDEATEFFPDYVNALIYSYKKYIAQQRKSSPSYKAVMRKHNSYPPLFNITNNLAVIYDRAQGVETHRERVQTDVNTFMDHNVSTPYTVITNSYLKNISKHTVVIKGIETITLDNGQKIYKDASIVLKPGEVTEAFNTSIREEYSDDAMEEIQYLGDVGRLEENGNNASSDESETSSSNDENAGAANAYHSAKVIDAHTLEIDSYTNTTAIKISKGNKISIKASGDIILGFWAGSGDPRGIDGYIGYCRLQQYRHGCLLVRIGNGEWTNTGLSKTLVADRSGVLQFMVNDNDPSNNSGHFTVEYSVSR